MKLATRKAEGDAREAQARAFLIRAGLRFCAANVRYRHGELDLVMEHDEALVFIEVRYREPHDFGGAAASVTLRKQGRIARAAASFLADHPHWANRPCRFDVVAIDGARIDWIRDAFRLDT